MMLPNSTKKTTTKEEIIMTTATTKPNNLAAIDAAIARAKEAKRAKDAGESTPGEGVTTEKPTKAPKAAREPKAPKEPKPAKDPKPARATAHLAKVQKARDGLPALTGEAQAMVTECIALNKFDAGELNAIAAHLGHAARLLTTSAACLSDKPEVGAYVKIVSGDHGAAKYIGHYAQLVEVRNIRCFADVLDAAGNVVKSKLYLFISDVRVTDEPQFTADDDAPAETEEPTTTATTETNEFPVDVPTTIEEPMADGDDASTASADDDVEADMEDASQPTGTEG